MYKYLAFITSLVALLSGPASHATTRECIEKPVLEQDIAEPGLTSGTRIPYPSINVEKIFAIYLEAVDDGQLIVFGIELDRASIQPRFVEYIYTLDSSLPIIKLYSMLVTAMPLPMQPEIKILGVSAIMSPEGDIIETIAHCGG